MTRRSEAFSLLEVLMTTAVLGLFMTMVCQCVVVAHRSHVQQSGKLGDLRQASAALDRLGRELRGTDRVYHPEPLPPNAFRTPLVFRTTGAAGPRVVGYGLNSETGTITQMVYRSDFDPADPDSQVVLKRRRVAESGERLEFTRLDPAETNGVPFLKVSLKLSSENQPLNLEVRVKSL